MELHEYMEAKAKFETELRKNGKAMLVPLFKELIGDGSVISGVKWTQYTDVYNDGEPCTFSVREHQFYLNVPPPQGIECAGYSCKNKWLIADKPKFCNECGEETPDAPGEVVCDSYHPWDEYPELEPLQGRLKKFEQVFNKLSSVLEKVFGDPCEVHVYDVGQGLEFEVDDAYEAPY